MNVSEAESTLGLHGLATMARVLGTSESLNVVLELAAEGARLTLHAASVSISRYDQEHGVLRAMINVGDLAPSETRWPEDETYAVARWPELARVLEYGATRTDSIKDPHLDPQERELLVRLGKTSSVTAAVIVDNEVWGELYATRGFGQPKFDEQAEHYVEVLVALIGGAISRALREERLTDAAR
jgi:GAF domain-containing protein